MSIKLTPGGPCRRRCRSFVGRALAAAGVALAEDRSADRAVQPARSAGMTREEKMSLSAVGSGLSLTGARSSELAAAPRGPGSAGYVRACRGLEYPPPEADSSLGVSRGMETGHRTQVHALASSLAHAASWNPKLAFCGAP